MLNFFRGVGCVLKLFCHSECLSLDNESLHGVSYLDFVRRDDCGEVYRCIVGVAKAKEGSQRGHPA